MITSNSRRAHRVDTGRDYVRTSPLQRAWRAIRRAVLLRWYRWQLECLRSERDGYVQAGSAGKQYIAECSKQERILRGRIAFLECCLDF